MERFPLSISICMCESPFLPNATHSARGATERDCCRGVRFASWLRGAEEAPEPQWTLRMVLWPRSAECPLAQGYSKRRGAPILRRGLWLWTYNRTASQRKLRKPGSAEAAEELASRPDPELLSKYDASRHRQRLSHPDRADQARPVPPVVQGAAHPLPGTSHSTQHEHDRSASTQLEHAQQASRKRKLEGTSLAHEEGAPSEHGQASVSCEQVPAPKAQDGADQLASTDTVPSRYPKRERRPNSKYFQALVALVQQLARTREPEQ